MNGLIKHIIFALTLSGAALTVPLQGATITEIESAVKAAKDSPKNQAANRRAADMLKDAGRFQEAIPFYLKSGNTGNLGIAESYFYLYDFGKADEYLDKYLEKRTKAEEEKDNEFSYGDGSETVDWTDHLRSRIELGRSMLDRVEKIQVIDSINVPAEEFFKFIKLAKSAGSFADEAEIEQLIPSGFMNAEGLSEIWAPAYKSESGDDIIWYGSSQDGDAKMYESFRLTDGSWDRPSALFDYKSIFGGNNGTWVCHPFLMADGVTLYFAADGDNSLGELDIFISRRDENGFLQPSNIGMPYNSPYNDYLYAIDEVTGIGWWATDRNGLRDSVTIYTFIPQDLRINYPVDTPNLVNYAKLTSIATTQNGETDYQAIRNKISAISTSKSKSDSNEFEFALPDGRIIRSFSECKNPASVDAIKQYQSEQAACKQLQEKLCELRREYAAGNHDTASEIMSLENAADHRKAELRRIKNSIVTTEMN